MRTTADCRRIFAYFRMTGKKVALVSQTLDVGVRG
jgi:hypothetical protein